MTSFSKKIKKAKRNAAGLGHLVAFKLGWTAKPLALRWNITSGCPKRCHYCNNETIARPEPTETEVQVILDRIIRSGPRRISISGGEPLTSKHFGKIVRSLSEAGISVIMNSSALGIERQAEHLQHLDLIQFSLDGPPEVCDRSRGRGTYNKVMDGVRLCQEQKIPFTFAMTLNKDNTTLDCVRFMLGLAKQFRTVVAFQPVKRVFGLEYEFDMSAPAAPAMQAVVAYLLDEKKRGNKAIRNTYVGLKHIAQWPQYPDIPCTGGKMFAVVQADGNLVACDRIDQELDTSINVKHEDLLPALKRIAEPKCAGCGFCGATELNYLNQSKWSVLATVGRL